VIASIANAFSLVIQKLKRLLKEPGRRRSFRNCRLENIKTRVMPVDRREGTRSIGIEELELGSLDQVGHVPGVTRNFRVSLKELPSRVDDRRSEERRVGKECRSRRSPDH